MTIRFHRPAAPSAPVLSITPLLPLVVVLVMIACGALVAPAEAQVVLNLPPPPAPAPAATSAPATATPVTVGDVALARFAGARSASRGSSAALRSRGYPRSWYGGYSGYGYGYGWPYGVSFGHGFHGRGHGHGFHHVPRIHAHPTSGQFTSAPGFPRSPRIRHGRHFSR